MKSTNICEENKLQLFDQPFRNFGLIYEFIHVVYRLIYGRRGKNFKLKWHFTVPMSMFYSIKYFNFHKKKLN